MLATARQRWHHLMTHPLRRRCALVGRSFRFDGKVCQGLHKRIRSLAPRTSHGTAYDIPAQGSSSIGIGTEVDRRVTAHFAMFPTGVHAATGSLLACMTIQELYDDGVVLAAGQVEMPDFRANTATAADLLAVRRVFVAPGDDETADQELSEAAYEALVSKTGHAPAGAWKESLCVYEIKTGHEDADIEYGEFQLLSAPYTRRNWAAIQTQWFRNVAYQLFGVLVDEGRVLIANGTTVKTTAADAAVAAADIPSVLRRIGSANTAARAKGKRKRAAKKTPKGRVAKQTRKTAAKAKKIKK